MKITTSAFADSGLIPSRYTCDGADLSPPLAWQASPAGSQSFALICDDPDAPGGIFVHWVIYDLPAHLAALPEGVPAAPSLAAGGHQGRNDFGKMGYGGPCPPAGTHRYYFKLYALDRYLNLPSGATKAQLEQAMVGHVLATAEVMGRYQRQPR
ncbi:MAG TPA: YbhB/YbcL family Raf kinase inhibitor-like protein [Leptolyngbyaceae cyanobacterium M65_K2018_010]|nr:YbhB/YbcL family Raf kinase inhibitor-like protein [Leptolyngbyaceae cyanobacterium M65_K2018_010]